MQMRPAVQIQSIIKALTDVVLPAVDPGNKLAQEQSRLVIGLLTLMSKQLPLQFRFDCDELARLIALSQQLRQQARSAACLETPLAGLRPAVASAEAVLDRAKADPDEVLEAVRSLRAATGALVSAAYQDADAATVDALQQAVLGHAETQLLRDRSWLLMQGWEADPASVPPIEQLLAPRSIAREAPHDL